MDRYNGHLSVASGHTHHVDRTASFADLFLDTRKIINWILYSASLSELGLALYIRTLFALLIFSSIIFLVDYQICLRPDFH